MIRSHLAGPTLVAVASAGAMAAAFTGLALRGADEGPLFVGNANGSSITRAAGTEFTFGLQTLELTGNTPGTLKTVELVGDDEIELLGATVLPPPREVAAVQFLDGWPATHDEELDLTRQVPAEGASIGLRKNRREGWELLIGIRVSSEGHWHTQAIRVTYTVQGEEYQVDLPTEITICTDSSYEIDGHCPFE